MKTYIGVKKIEAEPMTRGDYNTYRGWQIPTDENPDDEVEDTGEASDEIDAMLNTLDELESSLDDLREAIQG